MSKMTFKRYELKYILSAENYKIFLEEIQKHLFLDKYKETTIQSLYYDTPSFQLIRTSIESPLYKEKVRLRCYGRGNQDSNVFLEIKKKYEKIVYKRRIELKLSSLEQFLNKEKQDLTQIEKELLYLFDYYYDLKPRVLLLYDRSAYLANDSDLRITFDRNVRFRLDDLDVTHELNGTKIFNDDEVLLEIKTASGYPEWLIRLLNDNKVYKTSFSKYGTVYKQFINKKEGTL